VARAAVAPLESLLRDDPQYRYDVLEARQALELSTAWYAAQRATDKDRDRIRRCFDDMLRHQQARDAASAARSDAQFHLAIAEASHNAVLVQLMGSLFELVLGTVAQNRRLMFVHDDLDAGASDCAAPQSHAGHCRRRAGAGQKRHRPAPGLCSRKAVRVGCRSGPTQAAGSFLLFLRHFS
jgi:DNA-binding GntR family transcriptional regulator